jgi:sterol desaturase/sphingolipid hydroxylase (fatty acid hydroxylase superfamily)
MPTPIDILLDPLTLTLLAMMAGLALWERLAPGRPLPRVRGWRARTLAGLFVYLMVSTYLPLLWADALAPLQVFDLSGWPVWAAAAAGVLVYQLGGYAYHRALHRVTPLWRAVHQMHHSAERLDVSSAFWFGPLDMVGWTLVPSVALTLIGLGAPAATAALLFITFLAIFQHANVRTPVWLGYLVQRPESHSVHHQRDVHAYNYGDIPLFDILFGTFRNPREFTGEVGFFDGSSRKIGPMLIGREIA